MLGVTTVTEMQRAEIPFLQTVRSSNGGRNRVHLRRMQHPPVGRHPVCQPSRPTPINRPIVEPCTLAPKNSAKFWVHSLTFFSCAVKYFGFVYHPPRLRRAPRTPVGGHNERKCKPTKHELALLNS